MRHSIQDGVDTVDGRTDPFRPLYGFSFDFIKQFGQQIEDEKPCSCAFVLDPHWAAARSLHIGLDEDLRKKNKLLAQLGGGERCIGDKTREIVFCDSHRIRERTQHDGQVTQGRMSGAFAGQRGIFPETNDDDIVLDDQEMIKTEITVDANLDGATRLLNKFADESEALLPPGEKPFDPRTILEARACRHCLEVFERTPG